MKSLSSLESELQVYHDHLNSWKKEHNGHYALVKEEDVRFYSTFEEGVREATRLYGQSGYLLKKVEDEHAIVLDFCGEGARSSV